MRSIILLAALSVAAWSGVAEDMPGGVVYGESYGQVFSEDLPIATDPTSGDVTVYTPIENILPRTEPIYVPTGDGFDWGTDRAVTTKTIGSGLDWDCDELTGDLYCCFDTWHTTNDSLLVYRSTDGGVTWSQFTLMTNSDGAITSSRIRVARTGGVTWICFMGLYDEPSGSDALWLRRIQSNGSGPVFEQVDDDVVYFDLDADVGATAYLHCTFVPDATDYDIYYARNAMTGAGWVDSELLFADPELSYPHPEIAAGTGGDVAVTYIDTRFTTNDEVRVKRSTDGGVVWLSSQQVSNNSGGYPLNGCDICYSRAATPLGWIFVVFETGPGDNLGWYHTADGGATWNYGGVLGTGTDENLPSLRGSKSSGSITVAYNADPGDMTYFSWASTSTPTSFSTPVQINDAPATGIWRPMAGWSSNMSAIAYSRSGGVGVYYDAFNFTGVEDGTGPATITIQTSPNPFSGQAQIDFSITEPSAVSLQIFSLDGRIVSTIADGQAFQAGSHSMVWDGAGSDGAPVPAGVYLCRLSASGVEATHRMVVVR